MLKSKDFTWLSEQLAGTAEAMGQELSESTASMMVADLAAFRKNDLAAALRRVRMEHTGRLTLKAILEQLDTLQGRLGGNEAWSLALQSADERNTVVWSDEIQEAWAAAAPMVQRRDTVGARMAFLEAYRRITESARTSFKRPQPLVSLGRDRDLRIKAISHAFKAGMLPLEDAQRHLAGVAQLDGQGELVALASGAPVITYQGGQPFKAPSQAGALVALVSNAPQAPEYALVAPEVAQRIRAILTSTKPTKKQRRAMAQARLERMKLKQAKRQAAQAVAHRLEGGQ